MQPSGNESLVHVSTYEDIEYDQTNRPGNEMNKETATEGEGIVYEEIKETSISMKDNIAYIAIKHKGF